MDDLKQYILTVICAASICSIVIAISEKNYTHTSVIKLLCAIFMSITVITPWLEIRLYNFTSYLGEIQSEADSIVESNTLYSENETKVLIKKQIEEYIYDKASMLGVAVCVDVKLSDTKPFAPERITLKGAITPYNKQRIQKIISDELGIPEDNQEWN